ncbi:MAG: hypothetical protein NVSMB19_26420 [Vulcanimicrobiaceae bacterium]
MSRRGCFGTGRERDVDEVLEGMRRVAPTIPPQPSHLFGQRGFGPAYPDGSRVVGYFHISGATFERVAYATDWK